MKKEIRSLRKKILYIVIILFVLFIATVAYPGCLTGGIDNLDFRISANKKTLKMNETKFTVTFKLQSKQVLPVCIECGFSIGDNIYLELYGPTGKIKLRYGVLDKALRKEYLVGERSHSENIAKYKGSCGTEDFGWNITGNYTFSAYYSSAFTGNQKIFSNTIKFEIKNE